MAEPISILELPQADGSIVEVPVLAGDTPESLAEVLKKNGYDSTKYQNEISQALAPSMGDDLAGSAPTAKPEGPKTIQDFVPDEYLIDLERQVKTTSPFASKFPALEARYQKELAQQMKLQGISDKPPPVPTADMIAKQKSKEGTVKDIANLIRLLPEIETYPGAMSVPAAWVQEKGAEWGNNAELAQYLQKIEQLKIPTIKQIQGDVGAVSDVQEKSAKEYFPYKPEMLFEKSGRPRAIVNLLTSIKSGSGIDLTEILTPEELMKAAGEDPEGVLKSYLDTILTKGAGAQQVSQPETQQQNPKETREERIRRLKNSLGTN